jgi:hypothetical protein
MLLVSSETEHLISQARKFSDKPVLVNSENFHTDYGVGYTSIIEFDDKTKFIEAVLSAKEVFYIPDLSDQKFDINDPTRSDRGLTENLLSLISQSKNINGLENLLGFKEVLPSLNLMSNLSDIRHSELPTLWNVGCSFTAGEGVAPTDRWGHLLGNKIDLPISFLAQNGSSITWQGNQILRSDIRKNDIVVWGLTTINRLPYYSLDQGEVHQMINSTSLKKMMAGLLIDDEYMYYLAITQMHAVINFTNKIGCKLLLVGLLSSGRDYFYFKHLPNYYHYFNADSFDFVDVGSDGSHPGPKQHQLYAEAIFNQLKKRGWV